MADEARKSISLEVQVLGANLPDVSSNDKSQRPNCLKPFFRSKQSTVSPELLIEQDKPQYHFLTKNVQKKMASIFEQPSRKLIFL